MPRSRSSHRRRGAPRGRGDRRENEPSRAGLRVGLATEADENAESKENGRKADDEQTDRANRQGREEVADVSGLEGDARLRRLVEGERPGVGSRVRVALRAE